jgi:regulatory protein
MAMTKSKSKSTVSEAVSAAVRQLSRSDKTEAELRRKLAGFGFSSAAIDVALERCRDYGYLNDQRFAMERARGLMRSGRGVGRKLAFDLRRRGLDEETVEKAMSAAAEEFPQEQVLIELLERRFPDFCYSNADDRQRRRVISFLQRRGFSLGVIFSVLRSAGN